MFSISTLRKTMMNDKNQWEKIKFNKKVRSKFLQVTNKHAEKIVKINADL